MAARYFDGNTDVQLGDRVALRVLFRKRVGRVVYVPGVSTFNPEFEYNGMNGSAFDWMTAPWWQLRSSLRPGISKRKSNSLSVTAPRVS